jgi:hypothetical protein
MDPRIVRFFARQLASGFADLRGAEAAVTLPVADRLLNEIIAEALPPSGPVSELQVRTRADNRIGVRIKLGVLSFLPPINLTVAIERQPELPASPELVLRLEMGAFLAMAGPAMRFLQALPPGLRFEQERIYVNLATLLAERGLGTLLDYTKQVQVTTVEGALVIAIHAAVPGN